MTSINVESWRGSGLQACYGTSEILDESREIVVVVKKSGGCSLLEEA